MIKSIKLANSYSSSEVGFIAKDLSNLFNNQMNVEFSTIILNKLFDELIEENSIKNKIKGLLLNIESKRKDEIKTIAENIQKAILSCKFSDDMKDDLMDGFETLSWSSDASAKDLLSKKEYRVNLIASPDYITEPFLIQGLQKESLPEKLKELYAKFFSYEEIIYRISSQIDNEFAIAAIIQKYEDVSATAIAYPKKINDEDLIEIYVFPGLINIDEIKNPDSDVKPDHYVIIKDSLKLKTANAGKQKYKNIVNDGIFLKQECQINNFILNDTVAIEIARLIKRASSVLEKKIQSIFKINSCDLKIVHVSNVLDLQKEYVSKIKLFKEDNKELDEDCPEVKDYESEEKCEKEKEEEIIESETYEPITKTNHEALKEIVEEPKEEQNKNEQKTENIQEQNKEPNSEDVEKNPTQNQDKEMSFEDIMSSKKPLNQMIEPEEETNKQEEVKQEREPIKNIVSPPKDSKEDNNSSSINTDAHSKDKFLNLQENNHANEEINELESKFEKEIMETNEDNLPDKTEETTTNNNNNNSENSEPIIEENENKEAESSENQEAETKEENKIENNTNPEETPQENKNLVNQEPINILNKEDKTNSENIDFTKEPENILEEKKESDENKEEDEFII